MGLWPISKERVGRSKASRGQAAVIDGFTDLMIALFGEDAAVCPRVVMGAAELALNAPVIIEGEVEIAHPRNGAKD